MTYSVRLALIPLKLFLLLVIIGSAGSSAWAVTLDEALRSALQKNELANQSREHVVQAQKQVDQAQSVAYPSLSLGATHLVQPAQSDPDAAKFFPEKQTTASLSLKVPLFKGFREFAALRQKNKVLLSEKHQQVADFLMLYERVATSYLEVLALEQDLKNLGEQRDLYSQRIKKLQRRIRRGESQPSEALIAQSTKAALEAEIHIVRANLKSARETFSFLTALPAETELIDETPKRERSLRPLQEYLDRIEERPDVKSARERASAAQEQISIARGAHWPTLDAVGNYYLKRPDGYLSDINWDVQVQFTLPIFEGGLRKAQTKEASSKYRESELELSRIRRQARADIRSLFKSINLRKDQLTALKRSTELTEKTYQVIQKDYQRGLTRNIDVQMALTEYRASRRNYDKARYAARLEWIQLETAAAIIPASIAKEM